MDEKIIYHVLEIHAPRIRELVEKKKYHNSDDFVKTAIEVLLTWESAEPKECMKILRSLMPLSAQQKMFVNRDAKSASQFKHMMEDDMAPIDIPNQSISHDMIEYEEIAMQKKLADTNDDHKRLQENLENAIEYVCNLDVTKPNDVIPYDGYPLLSGFYSRILPVKIVLAVLADMLERSKSNAVKLQDLRVHAYDIAEEIAVILTRRENQYNIPRNEKKSTGLPKKGLYDKDEEKVAMAQKRFKDQYVGKVRRNRITKKIHFEGALSALGLVHAYYDEGVVWVSLDKLGVEFVKLENPILQGNYDGMALSNAESDYIIKWLIPQRELEKQFVDSCIELVKKYHDTPDKYSKKITDALDDMIRNISEQYVSEHPEVKNLYRLDVKSNDARRKISQWRFATMGRLAEMGIVKWKIDTSGDSVYVVRESR
ncbi:MAG: hypothetical protein OXC46_10250 [Thaumarchaeota archaeon]|nr:hypothetical protein [Nitrososphaerota archaeon]